MRKLLTILSVSLITFASQAQDKTVSRDLDKKLKQKAYYEVVQGKGVVVAVLSTDKAGKESTMNYELEFYDSELNKAWEWKDFEKVPFKWSETQMYPSYARKIRGAMDVDALGKNIFIYDGAGNKVYKIDMASGKSESTTLSKNIELDYFELEAYADDRYFYVVYLSRTKVKGEDPAPVHIFRIDAQSMKEEYFEATVPAVGKQNVNTGQRNWEIIGAYNNKIYFEDSHRTISKGSSYRQLLSFDVTDNSAKKAYMLIGDGNTEYTGHVKFNDLNDGNFYSFCTLKDKGRKSVFTCVNSDLDLVWQKKYEAGGGPGATTKIVGRTLVEYINQNVIISSTIGTDRFSIQYDGNEDKFKYADSWKYKKDVKIPVKYDMALSTYMILKKDAKLKAYLDKDMKKTSDDVIMHTLYTDKGVILVKDVVYTNQMYVQMNYFKF